jgi:hypothetical protein
MKKGGEEGMVGTLCQYSLKLWNVEWERGARVVEASIGRSGRQARTSRNRQGAHRPASALNTRMGCLTGAVESSALRCLFLGMHLYLHSTMQIIRGFRSNLKRKGDAV